MTIQMGDDEFILYIRKQYPTCTFPNDRLGKLIWAWIQTMDPEAKKTKEDLDCYWGELGSFVDAKKLPKTATQFQFNRAILPRLYSYLDGLGEGNHAIG